MTPPSNDSQTGKLAGTKLYTPAVILSYCILGNMPLGLFLYGRNSARRGQRVMGGVLSILSVLTLALLFLAAAVGVQSRGILSLPFLLSIFVGIGIFHLESGPYKPALARGETGARWWPPLFLVLLIWLLMVSSTYFITLNGAIQ
jgi:hypothetical protein